MRLDTSESLVDRSLWEEMGTFRPTGVNPRLVEKVRDGARRGRATSTCKIVASGGFDAERIREFERLGVPTDAYGVGSSLIRGANDYTADVVRVDGRPVREDRPRRARRLASDAASSDLQRERARCRCEEACSG